MGYSYHKKAKLWVVRFSINGKKEHFGSFKTEDEAKIVSKIKAEELMKSSLPSDISEYKDIVGCDGYKISKDGRIISFKNTAPKEIIPSKQTKGYLFVSLSWNGKNYKRLVHRLVYLTFIGEIPDGMIIDHVDRNKLNNNIDNLRAVTHSINSINCDKVDNARGFSKYKRKFRVTISADGNEKHMGYFNTENEARQAYISAKEKYHGIKLPE